MLDNGFRKGIGEQIPQLAVGNARRSVLCCHGALNSIGFATEQGTEQRSVPPSSVKYPQQ